MWGWVYGLFKALLEVLFKRADNATTTISHEATPKKIADANDADFDKWVREHKGR